MINILLNHCLQKKSYIGKDVYPRATWKSPRYRKISVEYYNLKKIIKHRQNQPGQL